MDWKLQVQGEIRELDGVWFKVLPNGVWFDVSDESWRFEELGKRLDSVFTRASQAWDGSELVPPNQMRIFGQDTKSPVVLVEGQRTNLLLHSDDFTNPVWEAVGGLIYTPNSAVAPDGTMTATTITGLPPSGSSISILRQFVYRDIDLDGRTFVYTIWAKGEAGKLGALQIFRGSGTPGSSTNYFTFTGEWQKLTVGPYTSEPGSLGIYVRFLRSNLNYPDEFYVWHPQVEEATFPSSYIPTEGVAATRALELFRADPLASKVLGTPFTIATAFNVSEDIAFPFRYMAWEFSIGNGTRFSLAAKWQNTNHTRVFSTGLPINLSRSIATTRGHFNTVFITYDGVGSLLIYVNGDFHSVDEGIEFPEFVEVGIGSRAMAVYDSAYGPTAPGASALGIPFIDNRAWTAEEIADAHTRWLAELEKVVIPV